MAFGMNDKLSLDVIKALFFQEFQLIFMVVTNK